eukprot:jgi/Galph1/4471/GphlegSOOS_G3127.1
MVALKRFSVSFNFRKAPKVIKTWHKIRNKDNSIIRLCILIFLTYIVCCCLSILFHLMKESFSLGAQWIEQREVTQIDVAVVSIGAWDISNMKRMVASLIMASSPWTSFHFHLFSDKTGLDIAKKWYSLWKSSCIEWDAYDIESTELTKTLERFHQFTEGKLKPTVHYHGKEAMWKLFIPSIISQRNALVENLIVLDTDMIILRDITELWNEWRFRMDEAYLGLPCMHRDNSWLYPMWRELFPDNGTLNCMSGTLLMKPKKMISRNWMETLSSLTLNLVKEYPGWTAISADQDIFNLFIKTFPENVARIGCEWNCYYTWFAKFLEQGTMPPTCSQKRCAIIHYNNRSYTQWWHNRTSFFQKFWDAYEDFPVAFLSAKGYPHCFF